MDDPFKKIFKDSCMSTVCALAEGKISFEEMTDYLNTYIESKENEMQKQIKEYFSDFIDVKDLYEQRGKRAEILILDDCSNLKKDKIHAIIKEKIRKEDMSEKD